jgi:hypothetical protein
VRFGPTIQLSATFPPPFRTPFGNGHPRGWEIGKKLERRCRSLTGARTSFDCGCSRHCRSSMSLVRGFSRQHSVLSPTGIKLWTAMHGGGGTNGARQGRAQSCLCLLLGMPQTISPFLVLGRMIER